jgi:hypothetical protein
MTYPEQLAELSAADPALGERVAGLRNLEAILGWAPAAGVPLAGIDLLQQDEYCYDLFETWANRYFPTPLSHTSNRRVHLTHVLPST